MPDEVADIRDAGDIDGVKAVIDENDPSFAGTLNAEELAQIKRAVE